MPTTYTANKLTGRSYRISDGVLTELSVPYQVLTPRLSSAPGIGDLTGFPTALSKPTSSDLSGLPSNPIEIGLYMLDVGVQEDASGAKWIFTATYKLVGGSGGGGAPSAEATEYTAKVRHSTKLVDVECAWDFDGKPFLNSAKRPYDKVPALRIPAKVVSVEKRLKAYVDVSDVSGKCNANTVTIHGTTFQAGCATIDAVCETTGDKKWPYSLSFTVEELISIDDQGANTGCRINLVNAGFEYLEGGKLVRAMVEDEKGELKPSPTPVLLDEAGERLADADDALTSIQYRLAEEVSWPSWVSA